MIPYPFYNPNNPVGMTSDNSMNSMLDERGYGVTNQMPQSMNPQPTGLPSTYQDRQSLSGMRPTYAQGGSTTPLTQYLQSMGQRGDTILAHINPQEAMELAQNHGGDINPHTGLAQFGFMDWVNDRLLTAPGGKFFGDKLLPALASIVGYTIGGPLGAVGAGTLTSAPLGAAESDNPWRGAAQGAAKGATIGGITALGAMGLGKLASLGALGGAKGAATAAGSAAAKRAAAFESLKALGAPTASKGLLGSLGSGAASLWKESSLLDKGLLGTALLGTLFGKNSGARPQPVFEENPTVLQHPGWRPDQMPGPAPAPYNRGMNAAAFDPYQAGYLPEHQYFNNYADGGRYYTGHEGGQDDNINARVSPGEFVMDADTVSALGDGNNSAGAKKLEMFRHHLREHKRSAPINKIPPKAKSISEYMLGGKR